MKVQELAGSYQWFGNELIIKAEEDALISCINKQGCEFSFNLNSELAGEIRDEMPYDGCEAVFVSSGKKLFSAETVIVYPGGDVQMFLKEMGRESAH